MIANCLWICFLTLGLSAVSAARTGNCGRCGPGTQCTNRGCECLPGFQDRRWGRRHGNYIYVCSDRNECKTGEVRCRRGTVCVNQPGSYDCQCREGWHGPWVTALGNMVCTEQSLCETGFHRCGRGTKCLSSNSTGYSCACAVGFASPTISKTDEFYTCSDKDECAEERSSGPVCGANSVCTNTPGSFLCQCREGFQSAWKDDIDCSIEETKPQTATTSEGLGVYQIVLAVAGSVVLLALLLAGVCYCIKRRKQRPKSQVNVRGSQRGQPITISVSTGRESSYVNVTLTTDDDVGGDHVATISSDKRHVYTNDPSFTDDVFVSDTATRKAQVDPSTISKPPRRRSSQDSDYVNHATLDKYWRSKSQEYPKVNKVILERPFSDSSVPIDPAPDIYTTVSDLELEKCASVGDEDYNRLQRTSCATTQAEYTDQVDHIYACPEDEDWLGESEASDSVFAASPRLSPITTAGADNCPTGVVYDPVIYSMPNKKPKEEILYVNNPVAK